jgi:hypothetical protein
MFLRKKTLQNNKVRYRICQNVSIAENPLKQKGHYIYTIQKHTIKDMPK